MNQRLYLLSKKLCTLGNLPDLKTVAIPIACPSLVCISGRLLPTKAGTTQGLLQGHSKAVLCETLLRPHPCMAFSPPLFSFPAPSVVTSGSTSLINNLHRKSVFRGSQPQTELRVMMGRLGKALQFWTCKMDQSQSWREEVWVTGQNVELEVEGPTTIATSLKT